MFEGNVTTKKSLQKEIQKLAAMIHADKKLVKMIVEELSESDG